MKTLKEKNFEIYSFLDNINGNDAGRIIDHCVGEIPKIQKPYGGYKTKEDLTQTLDFFLLDKNRNQNLFTSNNEYKDIFKIIKKTMKLLKTYQRRRKYIFVFPCFDNFTVEKMNGTGGICPKRDIILLFLNLNGKDWRKSLKCTLIHEFAHSVSDCYSDGRDFSIGKGMVLDGLAENFRKINFGGSDILINAISEEDSINYYKILKDKLDSIDSNFYNEVFYGTGKYPRWTGYTLGYYLIKGYLEKQKSIDWNILLRKDSKEILKDVKLPEARS